MCVVLLRMSCMSLWDVTLQSIVGIIWVFDPSCSIDVGCLEEITGLLKYNIDACISRAHNKTIFRAIINVSGQFMTRYSGYIEGVYSLGLAEVLGLQEILSWLKKSHMTNVIVEMDCREVVCVIHSVEDMISEFGQVIEDCRHLCFRKANLAAHTLARAATLYASLRVWKIVPNFFT
uniref:RNase H type-1 domain-containing protein n=1 Tax=Manihot esculenta TaxID=3983 RepID=A0A2C9V6L8_MANES